MCVAQQSLAMCQQCYLPCPRVEDHSGELASTGKPMSAVIRYKRLEDKYHQHGLQIELKVFPPRLSFQSGKYLIDQDKHNYNKALRLGPLLFSFFYIFVQGLEA